MKITFQKIFIITIFLVLIWFILINGDDVSKDFIMAFNLWLTRVFPALFPIFVISEILVNFGLVEVFRKLFGPLTKKIFKVSGSSAYVFFMSILSSTPGNAIFTKDLYEKGFLSKNEATKVLAFTFFPSIPFIYSFLTVFLNNQTMIIKVILTCYFVNIIIGLLFRNLYNEDITNKGYQPITSQSFTESFTNGIKKGMNSMLIILGTITFFIMLTSLLNNLLDINLTFKTFFQGIMEITQGLNSLITLDTSVKLKAIISGIFISFGGLSIHMQIKSVLINTPISYKLFFTSRIIHSIITAIILVLII